MLSPPACLSHPALLVGSLCSWPPRLSRSPSLTLYCFVLSETEIMSTVRHEHPVSPGPSYNICDRCNCRDGVVYHCSYGCDWDLCSRCIVSGPAVSLSCHRHPVRLAHMSRDWTCDLCHRVDSYGHRERWRCWECDFDVCGDCMAEPATIVDRSGTVPRHRHPLEYTRRFSWTCDECTTGYSLKSSYHCSTCDYDVCDRCVVDRTQIISVPRHSHALARIVYPTIKWKCDGCHEDGSAAPASRWRCLTCSDFDLCNACCGYRSASQPGALQTPPAATATIATPPAYTAPTFRSMSTPAASRSDVQPPAPSPRTTGTPTTTASSDGVTASRSEPAALSRSVVGALLDASHECVVCMEQQRDCVFVPCGHIACCHACALDLPAPRLCPVCRVVSTQVVRCFVA